MGCGKTTVYDFLNFEKLNWLKLASLYAAAVIFRINPLKSWAKCLVVDHTMMPRPRGKKIEILSRLFDHVSGRTGKFFCGLALSWTNGVSPVPVAEVIKASDKEQLQVWGAGWHDGRTVLGRRIKEALMPKTELVQMLVDLALNAGIPCDYVLMDTWFTYEPLTAQAVP